MCLGSDTTRSEEVLTRTLGASANVILTGAVSCLRFKIWLGVFIVGKRPSHRHVIGETHNFMGVPYVAS